MKNAKRLFSVILLTGFIFITGFQNREFEYPFQNPNLPIDVRVNDLVSRLTLEEKVGQMLNGAPAIPRLGIPAYDWWNEVLHGVARTPYRVTVYPQAIGMAATFDTASLFTMADYSATEGRAIFNKSIKDGKEGQRYLGLTYWTPNINIFRDPRWGRGQETYGEDPYLTSMLGKSFVLGLQGNDPKYLKAAACAKHYAVHSGPEPSRHVFDATASKYDLWDTYLPAFEELIVNAKVEGVMCAYNAFQSQPCCASDQLMNDILRNQWKFTGYVTSDCWAIDDFFKNHKTHPDAASASADAVMHGTDLDCGTDAYKSLVEAVKKGKITERQIDVSVKRLFTTRFKLGMFDPAEMVRYAQTSETVLESPAHKAHALKMAQQSIVLLKNEKNTLPLRKNLRKVAVVGPNADNAISVLGNYNGIPSEVTTVYEGIKEKLGPGVEVVYEKGSTFTRDTLLSYIDNAGQFSFDNKPGFQAEYFNNRDLTGPALLTRIESTVNHDWQEGEQVINGLKAYNFSARYTADFKASTTGEIAFEIEGDDGYRFLIDGKEVLNAWTRNRWGAKNYKIKTQPGTSHRLVLEYYQAEGKAAIKLRTGKFVKNDFKAMAKRLRTVDAIIYVGGISPQLEGEEMRVNEPGFDGGDRTSILLPAVQTETMKALKSTGKPVIFVMMTGSAIATPWEAANIPAILNAWYGGQSAGAAIADVIFGDYNPGGRLPVTFYRSDSDLPDFNDYSMANRTYRYFTTGKPLWPFGFGLSYTTFRYDQVEIPATWKVNKSMTVKVRLTNTGNRDGEEVAQLYVRHLNSKHKTPVQALKGFRRVALKAGESKTLTFVLQPRDLAVLNSEGNVEFEAGKLMISVGGGQPATGTDLNKNTVETTIELTN